MTNFAGSPSYFWFASSPKEPVQDDVAYTTAALRQDLLRVENAWDDCQASRNRDAIYRYLEAVFNLVAWWEAEKRSHEQARKALRLQHLGRFDHEDPFAAIIRCSSDPANVDKRTRSKWSRVMRYALEYKSDSESLSEFIKRKGGINECASRFARRLVRA
jgi:plasmid stabilization system protein ParE